MRNKFLILIFSLFLLTSCNQKADEEYLTGGNWIATAGYEDGEAKGEPNCHYFEEGLEFKDEETVYNTSFDQEFDYTLYDNDNETEISFYAPNLGVYNYIIHVINENEMGLEIADPDIELSCYLERE